MPPGRGFFVARHFAFRGLHTHSWPPRLPLDSSNIHVHDNNKRYSSIADVMLEQAAKSYETSKPKSNLAKQLFPSSSPAQDAKIDEQFKKARKSIGGYTSYTNSSNTLRTQSPNIMPPPKRNVANSNSSYKNSSSSSTLKPSNFSRVNSSASTNSSTHSIFSRADSFSTQGTIDLIDDFPLPFKKPPVIAIPAVEYDIDDFDDDADIDLDMDYDLPRSMPAPPRPSEQKQPSLPSLKCNTIPSSQQQASSAPTWSSSSPSHRRTPPGALKRRQEEDQLREIAEIRPAKRRSLPWLQEKAQQDQITAMEEEEELASSAQSTAPLRCIRCDQEGHTLATCPTKASGKIGKEKASAFAFTPKEKMTPWNSTASAVAENKRKFKDKQKAAKTHEDVKSKKKAALSPITLSQEQQNVLDLVTGQGKSVFFTGSAGTGKSVLMRAIIADLKKKHIREPDRVAVTASTGLAACNIGGVTLHSFGGIGLGKEDIPTLVRKIKRNQKAKNRWIRTKILIIDEISMVDGDLFDKLEGIARALRNNGRPFGGIQLVITGDFFQLPPVPDGDSKNKATKFAFDAATWATAIHHTIGLTEVFRQKDPVFANMLNEMRLGKISNDTIAAFKKLSRTIPYEDTLTATELFPTRNEVDNANAFRMRDLHGKLYRFEALDGGQNPDERMREKLLSNMMAPQILELKKGAQVMLIKNMDDGLVNGSLGKVIGFMSEKTFEYYDNHPELFEDQLASNGLPEDAKEQLKDAGKIFPVVRFVQADGTERDLLVQREDWKVELPNGEVQASRSQIPLILAWALSIHKAQGQTLERVKIDLKKIFEKGQAYVALSRATNQAGLQVLNFDKSKVMAHPRVAQFYNSLYSVNKALEHPKVAAAAPGPKTAKSYEKEFTSRDKKPATYEFDEEEEALMASFG